jgi:hypothetical protein
MEIPQFLIEMSEQINTQDNRITANPIWQVCYDKEHVTAEGYEDYIVYGASDGDYNLILSTEEGSLLNNENAITYLIDNHSEWCKKWAHDFEREMDDFDFSEEFDNYEMGGLNIQKNYMTRRKEVVKVCLTEADAKWFIQRKQHDYPKLYTYVESMVFCPQMIELREWIKSLSEETK